MREGTLYIVSTPIGNLEDITFRAIRTLKEVSIIAAEDTRRTNILLNHYGIKAKSTSFHSYNIAKKTPHIVKRLLSGEDVALVSDSGTPGISDPGSVLIRECVAKDIPMTTIPGPTALISALVLSGKPTAKFIFEGFLSNKKAKRKNQIEKLKDEKRTVVVYESPHRIKKFLEDFLEVAGDREIVLARELTKKFEEVKREKVSDHIERFKEANPKGEFVVIF